MRDINFFKPYLGRNKEKINLKKYIYGTSTIVIIAIVGTLGYNTFKLFSLNNSIKGYNEKLSDSKMAEKLKNAEDINKQITILKEYDIALNDVAVSVKSRDNVSATLLNDISSTVPSEVSFQSLNISDNTILIKGLATDRTAIAELKHNLSALSNMHDVYVNSISIGKSSTETEYSFDIKCVLKDVE
ncbi:PilN domain-containing protein [Clostridium beijerinckii]|uniref:Fimbrial protein n=1 Tax=Clostridium beijerinckii TaxID=1520 RepID=A0A1S9NCL1_CLOBE|nr:PilN domain-containing protein [Clostridium beijerinckii]MZK51675.1 fimbrial protein [Clostridium beijerinckii]MZK60418.1 fimbrial protein [Clostridium beijerinckii]MZK70235.1 fimbrial protein [Clostridium beijerinckii]MZK75478.1 fimbrial protein [Clostridium beijerinckii]MZK85085.1 fimbrial protein [Clostridium beijerinckii]